jgi:hypothetical protein
MVFFNRSLVQTEKKQTSILEILLSFKAEKELSKIE